jgi:hypothetical protein
LLDHATALPAVLRCADAAAGLPAGAVLAAEAIAFPNFATALADPIGPVGRPALRAVVRVARGCRDGAINPGCMLRVGLGDILAGLSETAPALPDPWLTAAILEAERVFRRIGHWSRLLASEIGPFAERQGMRLWASAGQRTDSLAGAPGRLLTRFPVASSDEQAAILACLHEFRIDVTRLFPHLPGRRVPWWADAVRCLTWSRSAAAGPVLAAHATRWLSARRSRPLAAALLAALRGHACPEAEAVLLRAASAGHAELRRAAAAAMGWWPPFDPAAVMASLRELRTDPDAGTRGAAVAALARLGERAALAEIGSGLTAEEPAIRAATARFIAA